MRQVLLIILACCLSFVVGFKGCGGSSDETSVSSEGFGTKGVFAYAPPETDILLMNAHALAIDASDNLYVTGRPEEADYFPYMSLWKFLADGVIAWDVSAPMYEILASGEDPTARNFEYSCGWSVALDNSGSVLVAGGHGLKELYGTGYNWDMNMIVWRYLPDGTADTSFGSNGFFMFDDGMEEDGRAVAITDQGSIIVAGDIMEQEGSLPRLTVWKITPQGALDTTFGSGQGYVSFYSATLRGRMYDLILDAQGRILVAGELLYLNDGYNTGDIAVWRFLPDGTLDPAFGSGMGYVTVPVPGIETFLGQRDYAAGIALDGQGRILVAGTSYQSQTIVGTVETMDDDLVLLRLNDDGSLDEPFGTNGMFVLSPEKEEVGAGSMKMRYDFAENKIYVLGWMRPGNNQGSSPVLWKFTDQGSLDTSFADQGTLILPPPSDEDGEIETAGLELDSAGNAIVLGSAQKKMVLWRVSPSGVIGD